MSLGSTAQLPLIQITTQSREEGDGVLFGDILNLFSQCVGKFGVGRREAGCVDRHPRVRESAANRCISS